VEKERPDLERTKAQLVISNAQMRKELKEIEDTILFKLSNVVGNILDDQALIDALAASKAR
jgi:dynein heavy chain